MQKNTLDLIRNSDKKPKAMVEELSQKAIKKGLLLGSAFGVLDVLLMLPMELENKPVALSGAFFGRFAIGFLIPNTKMPLPHWVKGALVGLLISVSEAIVTGAYIPIVTIGVLGGSLVGVVSKKMEHVQLETK
jgi:hypothetical protein